MVSARRKFPIPLNTGCEKCKHRKPELEEFFYLLVTCLKLVHPQKDWVLVCKAKDIYELAKKRAGLQIYEYISFIQNYLDKYALKTKYSRKKKAKNIHRAEEVLSKEPRITFMRNPKDYDVIDGYFTTDDSNLYLN